MNSQNKTKLPPCFTWELEPVYKPKRTLGHLNPGRKMAMNFKSLNNAFGFGILNSMPLEAEVCDFSSVIFDLVFTL